MMTPQHILIVLLGAIGDVSRAFVLLPCLKKAFPECQITWLVEPRSKSIVEHHPMIDNCILFDRNSGIFGFITAVKKLRKQKYDIVLDLQRHFKSGIFSLLSGGNRRIGFNRADSKEFNWIFSSETINKYGDEISKVDHYLKFLLPLNIPEPDEVTFGYNLAPSPESHKLHLSQIGGNFIGLVLGSTWETKDWFEDGYRELIGIILSRYNGKIVLMGDKSKLDLAKNLLSYARSERMISMVGVTTLHELFFLLRDAECVVGPDSGPGHMSAIFNTPYITLFGPTDPKRVAPYGMEELSIKSFIGCSPCKRRLCPGLDKLCMRLIHPENVWQMVYKVLSESGNIVKID